MGDFEGCLGIGIDEAADELVRMGLVPEGYTADDLVQHLSKPIAEMKSGSAPTESTQGPVQRISDVSLANMADYGLGDAPLNIFLLEDRQLLQEAGLVYRGKLTEDGKETDIVNTDALWKERDRRFQEGKEARRKSLYGSSEGGAALFQDDLSNISPEENQQRGLAAMEKVIAEQTDIKDAMFREEVGSISFYWGTPGKGKKFKGGSGVSHIIAKRNAEGEDGEAVAKKAVDVLSYGEIGKEYGPEGWVRRNVTHDGHTAVLSLYKWGNQETWLVTGWKDNEQTPSQQAEVHVSDLPTSLEPTLNRPKAAGVVDENINPLGADGKPLFHLADSEFQPITKTPAFRNWFGDSKVVDENGEPLVVYHGSPIDRHPPCRLSSSHGA